MSNTDGMNDQLAAVSAGEQKAIVELCVLAAFADGNLSEAERNEIQQIAERCSKDNSELTAGIQEALSGKVSAGSLAAQLASTEAKALAYEMAVCICQVDQALNDREQKFLAELGASLGLDLQASADFRQAAAVTREEPPVIAQHAGTGRDQLDEMIRDHAVLAGALELMPQRLATMAIVPVQMRMVYKIGKSFGYELDLGHTKEFFATVGVGLTSQVVEEYLSKIVSNVTRKVAGRFAGMLASQLSESAVAFATTYALGQVAKSYYAGGRTLSTGQLRELFSRMLNEGRTMQSRYGSEIAQRAGGLKVADFLSLARK